ncbi:MAG: AAA family ATPase [Candidatus Omnitrophota bacterium]
MGWNHVECHPIVRQTIVSAIEKGRMRGTQLIFGPPNCGQEAIALAIALALNCKTSGGDFCGECLNCRRIRDKIFPDVYYMFPIEDWDDPKRKGQDYSIGHMRMVQECAQTYPYESQYKIFIFNDAHRMTTEAANSLLKILEEPFPHNLFLLLTNNVFRILPTILSRCQKIRLAPLDAAALVESLRGELPEDAAETLARASGGIPRQARMLLESNYIQTRDEAIGLLRQIRSQASSISGLAERIAKEPREAIRSQLTLLMGILRDGALLAEGIEDGPFLNPDRRKEIAGLFQNEKAEDLIAGLDKILEVMVGLDRNIHTQLQMMELFLVLRFSP